MAVKKDLLEKVVLYARHYLLRSNDVGKSEGDPSFTALTIWTIIMFLVFLYLCIEPNSSSHPSTFSAGQAE